MFTNTALSDTIYMSNVSLKLNEWKRHRTLYGRANLYIYDERTLVNTYH